jgi:hypothetical protein
MHILTSNSMVSHAMWKNTREFLNTSKCTRSLNSCNFDRLWITHSCILFPDCTRNHTNAYTNNYRVYKKRRPLEINHIVKIWIHFQLHICWTVVRAILMECIRKRRPLEIEITFKQKIVCSWGDGKIIWAFILRIWKRSRDKK